MSRLLILVALAAFAGLTLLLSELRWFKRPSLTRRLAPYGPAGAAASYEGLSSLAFTAEALVAGCQAIGERAARLFGVSEELGVRLSRIHSPLDAGRFRVRQLGWSAAAMVAAGLVATLAGLPTVFAALFVLGSPLLAFLFLERQLDSASARWQRRIFTELPVVAEQLGTLTSAGWSLSSAIERIASRGTGACAADLGRVRSRMRQGLSEAEALREWGELAGVEELDRLISVLALNREATDLGRLISDEARSVRRQAQRELLESIERRNQQVWVPVTVAALVPGVLLMGTPFVDALTLFAA